MATRGKIHVAMTALTRRLIDSPGLAGACTVPDYPYLGPERSTAHVKVSFIGKANYRWPPPHHPNFLGRATGESNAPLAWYVSQGASIEEILTASRQAGVEFREERVAGYYAGRARGHRSKESATGYAAPWWQFIVEFTTGLRQGLPDLPSWRDYTKEAASTVRSLHTSNLFKVAHIMANPRGPLVSAQLEAGAATLLQAELEVALPDVVVLPIGRDYRAWLPQLLPGFRAQPLETRTGMVEEATWQGFEGLGLLTRHPQGASREHCQEIFAIARERLSQETRW